MTKRILSVLVAMFIVCGCSEMPPLSRPAGRPLENAEQIQLRANAASLLFDLLEDEKNVSKIFVIKNGSREVIGLIQLKLLPA